MKLLIFGAKGFLGQRFVDEFEGAEGSTIDIANVDAVASELDRQCPDAVINCAGKTGRPNIDWCEDHREETLRSNVTGPLVLLDACLKRNLYFVHFGSGCVYEGDNRGHGFAEDDEPNFFGSFYSRTKAWSDRMLSEFPVLILRVRMPFEGTLHPRTLIGKLVRYDQVLDAPNSITYIPDLLQTTWTLMTQRRTGIFHIVNPGAASPYQIMRRYTEVVDPGKRITRISSDELDNLTAARRSNCLLSTAKLERFGIQLRPIDEAVNQAILEIANAEKTPGTRQD